ncbi:DUF2793 domain-containing protein [Ochrobactrum pseudogrignonense]|uniref:DUF2793 domain-containing protein n=1 Tax=Brucella pseudogrignonensis TaxID=419475 RepID=A0A7Y3T9N6_9HYPH|nr:phage tail protein [Brucella pseudogrignonensis]NNV22640.1 DUF2793 domain-containing protein [Brucella pseudogrignonensis]
MAQNYFSIVTNIGRNKLALSAAGGAAVTITHFAIGDGNGAEVNPTAASTSLVREVWRTPVESVVIDPLNPSAVLVTSIIPTASGGWWMREFGIFDVDGDMVAVAKPVSQYKPTALEGQLEDIRYEFQLIIGETANVTMLVDPSVLLASRDFVEKRKVPVAQLSLTPWVPVKSMTITAPPANPAAWDTYVIPNGATGAWAGHAQKLAEWNGQIWNIVAPLDGHGISLPDGRVFEKVAGTYIEKIAIDAQSGKWSYGVTAGSANALTLSISPAPQSYVAGLIVRARISTTNTAAGPTLNVNGLGAKPIRYSNGRDVFAGELASGRDAVFYYDGAAFILMNPMLYFEKLAPKAARRWNAFTPGVALSDISGVKSANSAQSIASITGVTYLSVSAYCGVKNISTTFAGVIGYLVLRRSGQADQGSQYLGIYTNGSGSEASSIQQPMTLSAEFNNLDPAATYTLYLMVEKDLATGPIVVLDTYIRALSD